MQQEGEDFHSGVNVIISAIFLACTLNNNIRCFRQRRLSTSTRSPSQSANVTPTTLLTVTSRTPFVLGRATTSGRLDHSIGNRYQAMWRGSAIAHTWTSSLPKVGPTARGYCADQLHVSRPFGTSTGLPNSMIAAALRFVFE